jgi:uncharacterized protein YkwD
MKFFILVAILFTFYLCQTVQRGRRFTEEEIKKILDAHNAARKEITDSVQPIPPLKWNKDLENTAFYWANTCRNAHNLFNITTPGFRAVGENIHYETPGFPGKFLIFIMIIRMDWYKCSNKMVRGKKTI